MYVKWSLHLPLDISHALEVQDNNNYYIRDQKSFRSACQGTLL